METNVFGKPVIEGNRLQRARTALNDPNAEGKRDEALAYVRAQKVKFGNGVSTLCIFYNATGESLTYNTENSWYGHMYDQSRPFRVQNGQWGAFFHVKTDLVPSGSVGFVVYQVKMNDGSDNLCKQVLCWQTPWDQLIYNTHAYCNIVDDSTVINIDDVYKNNEFSARQHAVREFGMFTNVAIEDATSPLFEAQLTLDDVANK